MVFLINADARNIISTQATFITRYEDSDKKPVRYLYITAYKLNMEKIGLTSRLGKVNIMMLKRANFFSASPKTSIKSKNRQEWFQSDLEEEYLHEIYPLYSPGEEDDEYEDEDGEKCSIMRNNV